MDTRLCKECGVDISQRYYNAVLCFPCLFSWGKRSGANKASSKVNRAVKRGMLPRVSTQQCVDCGKPAMVYDHRDYNKPLDVDPVCQSCNKLRGPAIYATTGEPT